MAAAKAPSVQHTIRFTPDEAARVERACAEFQRKTGVALSFSAFVRRAVATELARGKHG